MSLLPEAIGPIPEGTARSALDRRRPSRSRRGRRGWPDGCTPGFLPYSRQVTI